jgi:hypothetical protein
MRISPGAGQVGAGNATGKNEATGKGTAPARGCPLVHDVGVDPVRQRSACHGRSESRAFAQHLRLEVIPCSLCSWSQEWDGRTLAVSGPRLREGLGLLSRHTVANAVRQG